MNETTQSPITVNMVIGFLGAIGIIGLIGVIWLVHDGVDAAAVAVVTALVGPPIGALGAVLATTRSIQPAAVKAAGYQQAVAEVQALGDAQEQDVPPAPIVPPPPG